jgi:hypothetical protein
VGVTVLVGVYVGVTLGVIVLVGVKEGVTLGVTVTVAVGVGVGHPNPYVIDEPVNIPYVVLADSKLAQSVNKFIPV